MRRSFALPDCRPRLRRHLLLVLISGLLAALSGCIPQYKLIPPGDLAGMQCVNQCNQIQADCRHHAMDQADRAKAQCEQVADIEYIACLKYSKGDDRKACSRDSCFQTADTYNCDRDHHTCFESCGGTIIRVN